MRLFLSAPVTQAQVQNCINLLRTAKLSVDGGALVVRDGTKDSGGVILLRIEGESSEAIKILGKAGVVAST